MNARWIYVSRKRGPKPPRSVLVGEHEGEDQGRGVAGADVQFQGVRAPGNDDAEPDQFRVRRVADGELGRGGDVVADAGDILARLLQRLLDDRPHRRGAGEGIFPVLADGIGLAEVHEDAVLDGLGTGVGVDRFPERIFTGHSLMPFGPWGVHHVS